MRPLLERLRDPAKAEADEYQSLGDMCREAADEIERLHRKIEETKTVINDALRTSGLTVLVGNMHRVYLVLHELE
jgi:hypothetical protein